MKCYITHVTRNYIDVAINLAISIRTFSEIPLLVYCVNAEQEDYQRFDGIKDVYLRNIEFDLGDESTTDYHTTSQGNFYVNRNSLRIYHILCIKTIAMQKALEEGWEEVCYLDSDCIATPIVDELFDWSANISHYPLATEGIHQYVMFSENGVEWGNPFSGGSWPTPDNKLALEWPLMNFLGMNENQRGTYRTTNVLLMNSNCLEFIKTWRELCFILPKLVNVRRWAGFHEETIYNVLNWREGNLGLPLCYVNLGEGFETVKHLYSEQAIEGVTRWDDNDSTKNFYKIPDSKKNIKVLHGEKRKPEVEKILNFFLPQLNKDSKVLIQIDTFPDTKDKIEITKLCIESFRTLGYPILLTSHIDIPQELIDLCDYSFTDNLNILLPPSGDLNHFYYGNSQFKMSFLIEDMEAHSPSVITSWLNGAKFCQENGFTHFLKVEYDFILDGQDITKLKSSIIKSSYNDGFVLLRDDYIPPRIIFSRAEIINNLRIDIKTPEDYFKYCNLFDVDQDRRRMAGIFTYYLLKNNLNKMDIYPSENEKYFKSVSLEKYKRSFLGFFSPLIGTDGNFYLCSYGMSVDLYDWELLEDDIQILSGVVNLNDSVYSVNKINLHFDKKYKLKYSDITLEFDAQDVINKKFGKIEIR